MCQACSLALELPRARTLVSAVKSKAGRQEEGRERRVDADRGSSSMFSLGIPGLKRSGSQGSLNSLRSAVESLTLGGEEGLRVCRHCDVRLAARDRAISVRHSQPLLSLLYSKLMADRRRMLELLPQYAEMAASLWQGENVHRLSDANELRGKLLRLGDSVQISAKKVLEAGAIGIDGQEIVPEEGGPPIPPGPRQFLLQKRINSSSIGFLKTHLFGLDKLPEAKELEDLQDHRRLVVPCVNRAKNFQVVRLYIHSI